MTSVPYGRSHDKKCQLAFREENTVPSMETHTLENCLI